MILPPNNENVSAWRDPQRAIDSADFDAKFIEYDREKRARFFNDRYEKPKLLTSSEKREALTESENKENTGLGMHY